MNLCIVNVLISQNLEEIYKIKEIQYLSLIILRWVDKLGNAVVAKGLVTHLKFLNLFQECVYKHLNKNVIKFLENAYSKNSY